MAINRGYTASSFALEIDGKFAGWLSTVEGGGAFGVVSEKPSTNGPTDKFISEVKYDDITFTCGTPDAVLADWLVTFFEGQAPVHSGAVVFCDYQRQPARRLEWDKAHIAAVTFPELDGLSKQPVKLSVRIRPEVTRMTKAAGMTLPSVGKTAQGKSMLASNYSVVIPGVDCSRVAAVEPVTVSQEFVASGRGAPKPGPLQVGDLVLSVSEVGSADFVSWADDFIVRGNNSAAFEKSATIRYLASNFKNEILSLSLHPVGIHRLEPKVRTANVDKIAQVQVSMYCEQAELLLPAQEAVPPAVPPEDGPNNLREFLGVRLGADEVARRLRDTMKEPLMTSEADRQRRLGRDVGIAWAERRASLGELEELASIDGEWSSIALPPGHSLSEVMEATGLVPLQYDGSLELSRDPLVEGVVAGILKVMSEVSAGITANLK